MQTELSIEPECCTPIEALSPKVSREWSFRTTSDAYQIPSCEGQKAKASGWESATMNPPGRCATAVAAPLERGFKGKQEHGCKISGRKKMSEAKPRGNYGEGKKIIDAVIEKDTG